jgi:hypothetical protein
VGYFNGRFCENGVDESTVESNTRRVLNLTTNEAYTNMYRTGLMFYELNTWDLKGNSPWKRSVDQPLEGTFQGTVNQLAQITLLMDADAKLLDQALISDAGTASIAASNVKLVNSAGLFELAIPNLLPDG